MRNIFFVCIIFLLVGIFLLPRIGPAWDEPDNIFSGGQYWNFVTHGFDKVILTRVDDAASVFGGRIYSQAPSLARYPPIPNYAGTALVMLGKLVKIEPTAGNIIVAFHFATLVFFAVLVITVYYFGRLLGLTKWGSLLAALLTAGYPTLFGYGLANLKDTAQVALFTLSLYGLVRGTKNRDLRFMLGGAVVWGLAIATKFNAIYVPIIWILWMLRFKNLKSNILNLKSIGIVVVVGLVTAFAVWPYLWFDPVPRVLEVISYFTSVGQGYRIFWDGVLYQVGVGKSLWWYPWANILLVTPPVILAAALVGLIRSIKDRDMGILLLWIGVPLARSFLPTAAFYDGIRHFMEVLPPILILAAYGLTMQVKKAPISKILASIGIIAVGYCLFIDVTYFPYSSGYFNMFASNPNVRFDRDIEAFSVKEGIDYLHDTYKTIRVWVPIGGHLSWYYLILGDQYVYNSGDADSIVVVNKSSHFTREAFSAGIADSYTLVHTITRGNAIFAWVYRKKEAF